MRLPLTAGEISADWLTEALGTPVRSAVTEGARSGAASKVRVRVSGHGLPPRVIVKAPLTGTRLSGHLLSFYANEVAFYREIAPQLAIPTPRCVFAAADPEQGQAVVVLEALETARFLTAGDTLTAAQAADVLDVYAQLHAATWEHRRLARVDAYPGAMTEILVGMLSGRYWQGCLDRPRSAAIPAGLREPGAFRAAIEALWRSDAAGPRCYVHGDAHVGNVYFDGERPGLIDWQMGGAGHWCHDVAYLVGSALDPAIRAGHDRELLEHYLTRLAAHGGPQLDAGPAWNSYRRHIIHGMFWATNADGMYPEAVNTEVVARFARASEELGALEALAAV